MAVWDATETVADVAVATTVVSGSSFFCFAVAVAETAAASETGRSFYRADMITGHGSLPRPVLFLFQIHLPADSSSAKGMHIVFINTFCPITLVLSAPFVCCSLLFFCLRFDCPNVSSPFSATYSLHLIHTQHFHQLPVFVSIFRLLLLLFNFRYDTYHII